MGTIRFSVVIFYDSEGKILLQDRRNLGKDAIEWAWFGGRAEGSESPVETAIREIREEINIELRPEDLTYIGKVVKETVFLDDIREGSIFCTPWRIDFEKVFIVLEGAGFEWMTPDEMRSRFVYETQRVHLSIFEEYIKHNPINKN